MTQPAGIAGVFDRAADTYDAVGVPWFRPIAAWLVAALAPQPGERALDVGCGRGAALLPLAEGVGVDGSVLGVDLAPRMVAATARDTAHLPQVSVEVGDAASLRLAASSYDVVASSLVLFFLADPAAALRSWVELLVPGGRLGVTTFAGQDPHWAAVDQVFLPYLPEGMRDARTSGAKGPYASDAGVADLLRGAGLQQVQTLTRTLPVVLADADQWHEFSWSHGQRAMWEAVPQGDRPQVRALAEQALAGARDGAGRIHFTQDVRITLGQAAG